MIKLTFAGDIVFADTCYDIGIGFNKKVSKEGNYKFLSELAEPFKESDISIANLEFVVSDKTQKTGLDSLQFIAPSKITDVLSELNLNYMSVANNHILDHGELGLNNTLDNLKKSGINTIGNYETPYQIIDIKGLKIAVICASTKYESSYGNVIGKYNNIYFPIRITEAEYSLIIKELKPQYKEVFTNSYIRHDDFYNLNISYARASLENEIQLYEIIFDAYINMKLENAVFNQIRILKQDCDFIITYLHWGDEYVKVPAPWQIKYAHKLVDLGVGLVVGCHSHCIQGIEEYNNTPIIYSLGNYYFNSTNPMENYGMILNVEIHNKDNKISIHNYSVIPTKYDYHNMDVKILHQENANEVHDVIKKSSKEIETINYNQYIKKVVYGLQESRKYKKQYFIKNLLKLSPKLVYLVVMDYIRRRLIKN